MRRHVDAEQAQAFERAGHGLRVLRFHDVHIDLQAVGCRLVCFRHAFLQEHCDELHGGVEIAGQELAVRPFKPQLECQLVMAFPIAFLQQGHAGREIHAGRCVSRRCLGLASGMQVDPRHLCLLIWFNEACST